MCMQCVVQWLSVCFCVGVLQYNAQAVEVNWNWSSSQDVVVCWMGGMPFTVRVVVSRRASRRLCFILPEGLECFHRVLDG